jgi:anti-anti-sigma factor
VSLIASQQRFADPIGPRPRIVDLSGMDDAGLATAVRDAWRGPRDGVGELVILDLGSRRTLPLDAIDELLVTHRALCRAGGRCAVIVGPALAAQLSLAHPEGILWAADQDAATSALGPRRAQIAAAATFRPRRRSLHVELSGDIDLATLPALEALLAETQAIAGRRREIVFDLAGVTFVDLIGLRAIATAAVRCQLAGARVRVSGARFPVRRLAQQLGWQEQLPGIAA